MARAARAGWDRRPFGRLLLGALLVVTLVESSARNASADDGYVVEYGDTLSAIADAYGVTVEQLAWLNGIDDPDLIYAGQFLFVIPDYEAEPVDEQPDVTGVDEPDSDDDWVDAPDDEVSSGVPPYVDPWTIQDYLAQAAWLYGWDVNLIMALAWQESGWQQDEVSWVGAIGVMQLMPGTAASLDDWYFARDLDVWNNAWDNVEAGVAYLTMLYDETGSVELALAGYYQGLGSVYADGLFLETEDYVANILLLRDLFAEGILP
jgi:LysM repeat protein